VDTLGQNYGFWIEPYDGMGREKERLIRNGVELVCRISAAGVKILELEEATIGMLLKVSPDGADYLTVHCFDGIVLFGVYEEKENKIVNTLWCDKYKKLSYNMLKRFADRCETTLLEKKEGRYPAELFKLSDAWGNYIENNPVLIQRVKEAQTNNNVFLEKKDIDEKER